MKTSIRKYSLGFGLGVPFAPPPRSGSAPLLWLGLLQAPACVHRPKPPPLQPSTTPCEHDRTYWKHLRTKAAQRHMVCTFCGHKWRQQTALARNAFGRAPPPPAPAPAAPEHRGLPAVPCPCHFSAPDVAAAAHQWHAAPDAGAPAGVWVVRRWLVLRRLRPWPFRGLAPLQCLRHAGQGG